jgi:hypothetical protein
MELTVATSSDENWELLEMELQLQLQLQLQLIDLLRRVIGLAFSDASAK